MSLSSVTSQTQALTEWVRVFPKQVTETYTGSVTFMKQLTIVAVSTISYLKNAFPEESYTVENFGGIKLRILKKKCAHDLAQFVSTALAQAFEAFEKKYLQKLALCFYDGDCNIESLVEYHVFEYSYTPEGVTMGVTSKGPGGAHSAKFSFDDVRERTLQLIRACVVIMQSCQNPLPASYDVSLRLYYNDAAPAGYQAPGYLCAAERQDHLQGAGAVRLGVVATPYHRLVASSYIRDAMGASNEAQPSQNAPMMTQHEGGESVSLQEERSEIESGAPRVLCLCGRGDVDEELMLTCEYCGTLQHAACFGLRRVTARHCCTRCSDADPQLPPTDPRLAQLSAKKRECLCILRRALVWCGSLAAVGLAALMGKFGLSPVTAAKLLKLLHSHGLLHHTDRDIMSPRKIIKEQLVSVMDKYFQAEEPDLVERLLAETHPLPHPHPDPLGEVLGPMERVSLHNSTALGKIIEPPPQDAAMEDATLKQYKEVVLSNQQTEELPLSGNHNPVKDMEMIGKKGGKRKTEETLRAGVKTKRAKANKQSTQK